MNMPKTMADERDEPLRIDAVGFGRGRRGGSRRRRAGPPARIQCVDVRHGGRFSVDRLQSALLRCGLPARPAPAPCLVRSVTLGVDADDRPTCRAAADHARPACWSTRTRTGTRCTTLVKLPVAFSGGSSENTDPEAGAKLTTWPWKTWPGTASTSMSTGWPGCRSRELGFLEIGIDIDVIERHQAGQPLAGLD